MNSLSIAVMGLAFVAFYVGVHHLIFFVQARDRRELVAFALMCFIIAVYDSASAGLYSVSSAGESVFWLQWQFRTTTLFGIFFLKFVSDFTGKRAGRLDYGLWACWIILLVAHLFPSMHEWSGATPSPKVCMLFGAEIIYYESESGILSTLRDVVGLVTLVYGLVSLGRYTRQIDRSEALPILIGTACLSATVVNDVLEANRFIHSIYLMEWGFMALVFGVAYSVGISHYQIRSSLSMTEAQRRRLAGAVNDTGESIMITDTTGIIQYVNPAFERMTGYLSGECIGHPASMLKSGKHGAAFYDDMWSRIKSGRTWHGIFTDRRKNGSLFEEDSAISPIRDHAGEIVSFVAVKRDITRERFLEKQVQRSLNMSAIGQFAHRVAHDFNNALTSILAYSEMIHRDAGSRGLEQIGTHAAQIKVAGLGIAKLNGDLMAFAHPGKLQLRKVKVEKLLKGSENIIRRSVGSRVVLSMDAGEDSGAVMIDQARIEKAIVELVLNACEAMKEEGSLSVNVRGMTASDVPVVSRLSGIPEDDPGIDQFAVIVVSDAGPGIGEEDMSRIFDPFFTTRDRSRHAGLGLSHVWQIVSEHGGFINAESGPGPGATFKIFFPLVRA